MYGLNDDSIQKLNRFAEEISRTFIDRDGLDIDEQAARNIANLYEEACLEMFQLHKNIMRELIENEGLPDYLHDFLAIYHYAGTAATQESRRQIISLLNSDEDSRKQRLQELNEIINAIRYSQIAQEFLAFGRYLHLADDPDVKTKNIGSTADHYDTMSIIMKSLKHLMNTIFKNKYIDAAMNAVLEVIDMMKKRS